MIPKLLASRVIVCLSTFLLCVTALVAHAANPPAPIRIGLSLGLTGTYAAIGDMQQKAYGLWQREVNARGGILGRPVELKIRDDGSNPNNAKRIYEELIVRDKVDFIFSPYSSDITGAVAPITETHRYPMVAAGAASDELWKRGYTHLFGTIPPAGRYPIGFLAIMAEARITQLGVVYADDSFSVSVAEGAKRWALEYGLQIVLFRKIVKGTADLSGVAKEAREAGAQALLMTGHYEESVNMTKALKAIAWTPTAYYASVGPGLDAFYTALGSDTEGTFSTSVWEAREDLKLPGSAEFLRRFVAEYKQKPSYQGAQAYAAGQILEKAIQKAGKLNRAAVQEALYQLDTTVLIGRYVVDRTGSQTKRFPLIIQWQGGKREIVWPPEMQTAAPIIKK